MRRLLVLAALLAFTAVAPPATAAGRQVLPAGSPGQVAPDEPSVALAARSPWVTADGVLRIDVATEGDAGPLLARVTVRSAVDTVEELAASLEEDTGRTLYRMPPLPVGFLAVQADGSRRLELAVSDAEQGDLTVRLPEPGVYPVVVTFADDTGEVVSTIRTPVVRLGTEDDPLPAPDLDLLVELVAPPGVDVDGRRELADSTLERLVRLAELIGAGGDRPLSLTVNASPDTIDALTASPDPRAAAVLEALASAAADRTAIGSPYVPLHVPTLLAAGLGEFVRPAVDVGRSVLHDRLGASVDESLWVSADGIDAQSAAVLAGSGVRHVVVDAPPPSAERSPAAERPLVDAGPVPIAGSDAVDAVVVDTATSVALSARATGRVDAGHVALAELILRDDQRASTVTIRADDVADDSVLASLLALLADPASPIDVGPVDPESSDDEDEEGDDTSTELEVPEPTLEDLSELTSIEAEVRSVAGTLGTFAALLGAESARADDLRLQLLTSVARGVDTERRHRLVDSVTGTVESTFRAVSITGQTDLNLTSRRGTLPLMVRNDNPFPVDVVLRIRSDRLDFPEGDRRCAPATGSPSCFELTIPPQEIARVDVPVTARATGSVPTFVHILTPDEQVVLDSRDLVVRSTAVSGVGLAISLGALAVLIIWWARTWHRNRTDRGADPGS